MSKKMIIMSQDMERTLVVGRGFNAVIKKVVDEGFSVCCYEGAYGERLGTYPTMTEAKSVMGAIVQVYAHEGGIFYMPKASDAEEDEPEPEPEEPEEKNPWIPVEDGLPGTVRDVWVTCEDFDVIHPAWYDAGSGVWYATEFGRMVLPNVIAWREIDIKPYKKPEDD